MINVPHPARDQRFADDLLMIGDDPHRNAQETRVMDQAVVDRAVALLRDHLRAEIGRSFLVPTERRLDAIRSMTT